LMLKFDVFSLLIANNFKIRYGVNEMNFTQPLEPDMTEPTRIAPHKSLPTILSRILSTFRLENCMYRVNKQKEGTGRVVMHRRLKVP